MPTATITSKGQTTIPKEIRTHLHLQAGDRLEFVIDDAGRVLVIPATIDIAKLQGILPAPRRPVTIDEMNRAIRRRGGRKRSGSTPISSSDTVPLP